MSQIIAEDEAAPTVAPMEISYLAIIGGVFTARFVIDYDEEYEGDTRQLLTGAAMQLEQAFSLLPDVAKRKAVYLITSCDGDEPTFLTVKIEGRYWANITEFDFASKSVTMYCDDFTRLDGSAKPYGLMLEVFSDILLSQIRLHLENSYLRDIWADPTNEKARSALEKMFEVLSKEVRSYAG